MKVKQLFISLVFMLSSLALASVDRNVAPVLDISYSPVMTTILEGAYDNPGNSLSEFIDPASISDGDGNAAVAIAVISVDNTNGNWQYSLNDGASWFDFTALTGAVIDLSAAARLLDGTLTGTQTNRVRFVPAVDYPDTLAWTPPEVSYDGRSSFTFRAWDRTTGITGLTADASLIGGSTAFSAQSDVVGIVVSAVNDDPVLYYQGQAVTGVLHMGFAIDEDTAYHFQPGQCNIGDPDMGDNQIIFNVQATKGVLQFDVGERFISGNGTSNVTIVTDLPDLNYILDECSNYIPNLNANHTEVLTIRLNDQGWTGIGGGEDQTHLHTFWINPINDAPVLNVSYSPSLSSIQEDDLDNQGNSIASIIPNGSITDVDTLAVEAIAIVGVDNRNGHWEYSLDDGTTWQNISEEMDMLSSFNENALLLDGTLTGAARQRVRFLPAPDFYGSSTFTFRAWDKTEGFGGNRFDADLNGGITSISAQSDAASINVVSINDVPALCYRGQHDADTLQVFIPITAPMLHIFSPDDSLDITDPDIGSNVMMANIISQKGTMTFNNINTRYISNNGTGNVTITGTLADLNTRMDDVTYSVPAGETGYDFVNFVMSDFGYSGAGPVLNISNLMLIQLTNESPVYDSLPNTVAYEDSLYEYLIYTSDADTNRVWIDASVLPEWLTIVDNGDNTALLSGIPTNDHVGSNPVTLDIWDWVTPDTPVHQEFIIHVANTNDAPHFTSIPVLQVDEGSLYQYFVTAEDIDGGSSLTLAATVMPTWMNFVDNGDGTGLLSGTPLNIHVGFHPVTLTLTDGIVTSTVNQSFNVEVINVNSPPFVSVPIPDQFAAEDFTPDIVLNMDNYFADVDPGTTLYYSVAYDTLQIVAQIVNSDLILSPFPDWNGTTELTVTADDRHASAGRRSTRTRDITTDSFFVTLSPVNDAPRFVTNPRRVVTENTTYNYSPRAIEVDAGDPIFLGATVLPPWLTFTDNGNGVGLLTGFAASALLGYHPVTLTATDNIIVNPTEQSFNVYVNSIPVYTSTPILSVDEDSFYSYTITATDNNPDASLSFSSQTLPSWLTLVNHGDGTATLSGTPLNEHVGNNQVVIRLTDGFVSAPVLQSFIVNVINTNDAPYFTSIPETISHVGVDYLYTITAADDDVTDNLQFSSLPLPGWLTLVDNGDRTASLQGHPLPGDEGLENITLLLTDTNIATPIEQNFVLEVRDENVAPFFVSTPPLVAIQDELYTYNIQVQDNNNWATITISSLLIPGWCTFVDNGDGTAVMSGTPTVADLGFHDVILEATDGVIVSNIQQVFTLSVYDHNNPPSITSTPILNAVEDQNYQYLLVSSDPNFWATLTVSAPTLPAWLSLTDNGDGTALLEGTPLNQDVGANPVLLEVSDGVAAPVQQSFTIDVTNTNDAPVFTSVPVTEVDEGFLYTYNVSATDEDLGSSLTITGSNIPVWLTLTDNGDGTALLSGTPDGTDLGIYNVTLLVDDGIVAQPTAQPFVLTVNSFNYAPVFTSVPITTATEEVLYTYNITATDQNTWAVLNITAPVIPGWLTLIDNGNGTATLQGTPDDGDLGNNSVTLNLTDNQIAVPIVQSFVINVIGINDQPVFSVFPIDITINEGALYQTDITAQDDDGPALAITASVLPNWLTLTDNGNGTAHLEGTPDGNNLGLNPVTLGVSDGVAPIYEQSYQITVNQFNYSPSFVSSPVLTVLQDNLYTYNIVTTDPNTWAVITVTCPLIPAWLTFTDNGDGTALLTGTPTNAEVGPHAVTLRVSDGVSIPIDQQFNIQVINTNDGPIVSLPIPDQSVVEDFILPIEIDLNQHFFDSDGNALVYSFAGINSEINIDLSLNMLIITAVPDWYGTSSVIVTADDMLNRISVADTFNVVVTPVNDFPVFATTNDTTSVVGINYTYHGVVTDADPTDTITFGINGTLPAWLSYTPNNDRTVDFSGTPASADYGVYDFILTATDGTEAIQQDIHINVYEDNATPQFTSVPITQVDQDAVYTYNVTASDANDWATLAISPVILPSWLALTDNGDGSALLTGTPTNDEVGIHSVQLSVTDNIAAPVLQSFNVTVNNINDTPIVVLAFDDLVVDEDFTPFSIDLSLHFSDPDNDALVYSVSSINGEVTAQINANSLLISPVADWYGDTDLIVTASDQITRNQVSDDFVLTINPINDLPLFATENDTLATVSIVYNYQAVVNDADPTDTITFSIIGDVPAWLTYTANTDRTADFTGTPQSSDYGVYDFTLRATDGTETVDQEIHLNVWEDNYLPQFDSTPFLTATEDELYQYNIVVSDANAWNTLNLTTVALPSWLSLEYVNGEETAVLSGTPTNDEVGDWVVTLLLDDGVVANPVEQQFTVTVINVNDPPYLFNPITPIVLQEDFQDMFIIHWNEHFADDDLNDTLTYSVIGPDTLFFDFKWDNSDFIMSARNDASGTGIIRITVSDGHDEISGLRSIRSEITVDVPITIQPVNDAPTIVTPIADFSMDENTIDTHIDVTNVFDDVDFPYGDVLTYDWSNSTNINISLNGTVLVLEPVLNWYGTEIIQLTATDSQNEFVTDEFVVTVNNVSDVPEIEPITDQLYFNSMNGPFNYQVDFYAYPDIAFTLTGAPEGMTIDANGMISWFPLIEQMGLHTITVTGTNVAGFDEETFILRAVNEVFGPQNLSAQPLAVDTITLEWEEPPTDAWITGYKVYVSDSYNGAYSPLTEVDRDVNDYSYPVPDGGMTYFYKVSAVLDATVWQGETAFSTITSVYTMEEGEDEISNDDGSDEDTEPVFADTQLGIKYALNHRSEFVVSKVAVFITDLSTDDLVVEFSDAGTLPDNEISGLTVTYPAASINPGWNFLPIPEDIQPSFFGNSFFVRIIGSPDPWGIGLDTSTNGNTFKKVSNVWNPLLTGEAMVRAIIKQLDAIISVDTVEIDFGLIYTKDHSAPYDIGVSNIGNKDLIINTVNAPPGFEIRESGGTNWDESLSNITVIPSGSITIEVRFSPEMYKDEYTGDLEINSTDERNATVYVALNGRTMESEPNAFTPNGDGKNDTFNFKVISDTNESVKMTIFNLKGRKMKEITGRSNAPLVWNGKDDSGNECESGPYLYVVEKSGDRYQRGKIYLVK